MKEAHDLSIQSRREYKKSATLAAKEAKSSTQALVDAEMELELRVGQVEKKCKVSFLFLLLTSTYLHIHLHIY